MFRRKERAVELIQDNAEAERQKRIMAARLPADYAQVFTQTVARTLNPDLVGYYMFIAVGTFGVNQTVRTLLLLYLCGLEQLVGSMLIIENNASLREEFLKRIPSVFHARVVFGYSPSFVGGFSNKPTAYVLEHKDTWGVPIHHAARDVADLHQRQTGHAPAQILLNLSLGGSAPTGLPAVEYLAHEFRHTQIVGFTSLPEHERNRIKFAELKGLYDKLGLIGWTLSDKLAGDWVNADFCMAAMVVAPAAAQLHDDQTTQLNNIFTLAFTENPGGILIYQYVHTAVVASTWMVEGETLGHKVATQNVTEKVTQSLRDIERLEGHYSANLPIGEPGTSTFDLVMTSLGIDRRHNRDDLQGLRDHIVEAYTLRLRQLGQTGSRTHTPHLLFGLANYELIFGSLATTIDTAKPTCPVLVLRLMSVKNGAQIVSEIVKVPDHLLPSFATPIFPLPDHEQSTDDLLADPAFTQEPSNDESSTSDQRIADESIPRRGRPRKNPTI